MAEGIVAILITKITSLLENEYFLSQELHDELNEIKCELESMRSFLRSADRMNEGGDGVGIWVAQIREIAYDAEDVIDEFMYLMDRQQHMGFLRRAIFLPTYIYLRHHILDRLQDIKRRVQATAERSERYVFHRTAEEMNSSSTVERWRYHGEISFFVKDEDLVGIEETKDLLVGWLTDDEHPRKVISVVGMGGLGKTTVVAKAYSSQIVKGHFDCYAWVSVSQDYKMEELLEKIIVAFFDAQRLVIPSNISTMNYRQLVEILVSYLQQKRYVLVLDDVWDINVWGGMNIALPNNSFGSRILVTTRNEDVASSFGIGGHIHHLQPLRQSEAWALFCKKAFLGHQSTHCPQELENTARVIVEKCEGLPLAIAAMGGLLSLKGKTQLEWKKVSDGISWELSNNPMLEGVKGILWLSFNDLPHYLKHCFLYCNIFPQNYVFKRKHLIRLWVAEGFVEERRGMTIEEVADAYLGELICRNMIQAVDKETGRVGACRLHDLMRELALSRNDGFCAVYDGNEVSQSCPARRLSIQKGCSNIPVSIEKQHLRSLFLFAIDKICSSSIHKLLTGFRLLRVLDLTGSSLECVPDNIFDLFNLRYLSLRETKVKKISKLLGKLQKLQTLDVRNTLVESLPTTLLKLQNLRHLLIYRLSDDRYKTFHSFSGIQTPKGIWKLGCLQTLASIEADRMTISLLGNLAQLQRFEITEVRSAYGEGLGSSIQKMKHLLNLNIVAVDEEEVLQFENMFPAPPLLQTLRLTGRLETVPEGFASLRNLTRLCLRCSHLREDPLPSLKALCNLVFLQLFKAYDGEVLCFQSGWFPRLEEVNLRELSQLNCVNFEGGVMTNIQGLEIIACTQLKMLPQGIECLVGLQKFYLKDVAGELVQRLKDNMSMDRQRIQHIPNIRHCYKKGEEWVTERLS